MIDLKLDTLRKKPKVYNVAVLSAVMLAVLSLLFSFGGARLLRFSCLLLTAYFLGVAALLLRAFFLQMRYNLYSYNTIIYFGFALFTLYIAGTYAVLFFRLRDVLQEAVLPNLIGMLLSSAKTFALLTFPFLLIFSLALIVSNLSLIRHEGFRPVNVLGVVLALLLLGGEVLIFGLDFYATGSQTEVMLHDMLTNFLAAVYLYFECMMLGTMVADAIAARYEPEKNKDFLIVLGCAIRRDGTPTPLLRGRLERALAFARAQEAETGRAPVFVLSGGQGADEIVSEAECMRRWLAEQGVPEARMRLEDRSTDTAENMAFSKAIILEEKPDAVVAFSTTNYHVFRSGLKARRVKLKALGMGCRSKWYFWPNAAVREFVGLLTQHRLKQGLILFGLIAAYAALTWVHYHYL
jgi:uncharacterized SAM-binding protein YcdF (DUF218 family)